MSASISKKIKNKNHKMCLCKTFPITIIIIISSSRLHARSPSLIEPTWWVFAPLWSALVRFLVFPFLLLLLLLLLFTLPLLSVNLRTKKPAKERSRSSSEVRKIQKRGKKKSKFKRRIKTRIISKAHTDKKKRACLCLRAQTEPLSSPLCFWKLFSLDCR